MKKFLFIFVLLFGCVLSNAQNKIIHETAYEYAFNLDNTWSDWYKCDVAIEINIEKHRVIIFSQKLQVYEILEEAPTPPDNSGTQVGFTVIDQDGDIGRIRFRVQNNGNRQVYVDFQDVSWCYNIR